MNKNWYQKYELQIHTFMTRKMNGQKKYRVAEEIIVEHVLTSFSDSRLCCLPVLLHHMQT